ncbi:uncharacterized protein PG986_006516 [Apiospora aurea]|uniref:Uncharacterized protein n=1 Tax=Apiospora aurea TaxID=335848 RepID=A0ABR1QKK8_9PEZI
MHHGRLLVPRGQLLVGQLFFEGLVLAQEPQGRRDGREEGDAGDDGQADGGVLEGGGVAAAVVRVQGVRRADAILRGDHDGARRAAAAGRVAAAVLAAAVVASRYDGAVAGRRLDGFEMTMSYLCRYAHIDASLAHPELVGTEPSSQPAVGAVAEAERRAGVSLVGVPVQCATAREDAVLLYPELVAGDICLIVRPCFAVRGPALDLLCCDTGHKPDRQ